MNHIKMKQIITLMKCSNIVRQANSSVRIYLNYLNNITNIINNITNFEYL